MNRNLARQARADRNAAEARRRQDQEIIHHLQTVSRPLILGQTLSHAETSTEAIAGVGSLAILPNEVVMVILFQCTMRTLLNFTLVNRCFLELVNLLPDFRVVRSSVKLQLERAKPLYQQLLRRILKFTTYAGLRFLIMARECEKCHGTLASFRVSRVQVLCEGCFTRR